MKAKPAREIARSLRICISFLDEGNDTEFYQQLHLALGLANAHVKTSDKNPTQNPNP